VPWRRSVLLRNRPFPFHASQTVEPMVGERQGGLGGVHFMKRPRVPCPTLPGYHTFANAYLASGLARTLHNNPMRNTCKKNIKCVLITYITPSPTLLMICLLLHVPSPQPSSAHCLLSLLLLPMPPPTCRPYAHSPIRSLPQSSGPRARGSVEVVRVPMKG
jgi:hypothetical protein